MKPFLQSADPHQMETVIGDEEIYELRGVLLHKGPSAYHGHYEAQVYNQEWVVKPVLLLGSSNMTGRISLLRTKKWYQFNDEVVTPLSSFYSAKPASSTSNEPIVVDGNGDRSVLLKIPSAFGFWYSFLRGSSRPVKRQKRIANTRRVEDSEDEETIP